VPAPPQLRKGPIRPLVPLGCVHTVGTLPLAGPVTFRKGAGAPYRLSGGAPAPATRPSTQQVQN
jgi:hypothetical protein